MDKVHITSFKQRAKRVAKEKKKEKPKVKKPTSQVQDYFDNEFDKLKYDSYWMGY